MKTYNAKKPMQSYWQSAKSIVIRALCPPILIWDFAQFVINKLGGKAFGALILPVQDKDNSEHTINNLTIYNSSLLTHQRMKVITYDNAQLNTLEITHISQEDLPQKFQKYIIYFLGNATVYEQIIDQLQDDAIELQCNVVSFNYRGVPKDLGRTKPDGNLLRAQSGPEVVSDGIAQVQRLLDKGVSPQNIILKGFSLGGAIASMVALHFHELKQPVNLFNDRSFSSTTQIIVGKIRTQGVSGHHEDSYHRLLGMVAFPFVKLAVNLLNWEINAGYAYQQIPAGYKDYIVARSRKERRTQGTVDDIIVPHHASMHTFLKYERRTQKETMKEPPLAIKNQHKARKMETDQPYKDAHVVPLTELRNRHGKDALTFFREFTARAYEDHGIKPSPLELMP